MKITFSIAKARSHLRNGLFTDEFGKKLVENIKDGVDEIQILQRNKKIKRNDDFVNLLITYHDGNKNVLDEMKKIVHLY